jgi:hypothetical protein
MRGVENALKRKEIGLESALSNSWGLESALKRKSILICFLKSRFLSSESLDGMRTLLDFFATVVLDFLFVKTLLSFNQTEPC